MNHLYTRSVLVGTGSLATLVPLLMVLPLKVIINTSHRSKHYSFNTSMCI